MSTVYYPAVIERAKSGYSVFFPDVPGCVSAGRTISEAAVNAELALNEHLSLAAIEGFEIAEPSDPELIESDPDICEVARVLVRADRPGKAVRVNITLDEALLASIDRIAKNRSGFLAEAAEEALIRRRQRERYAMNELLEFESGSDLESIKPRRRTKVLES